MDLNIVWFILITVLFTGFFFLEGFDYGVGILLPFLGRDDKERRVIINTIGPFWDANEVWLITAGGAMFAAFPHLYATLFSGFYLALVLMLVALIVRGVAFEFRSKDQRLNWRRTWDWMLSGGSFVPALLWGVTLGNMIRGVPIDADMTYTGNLLTLLNPYALLCGVASLLIFTLHGAVFMSLKTKAEISERAKRAARALWLPTLICAGLAIGVGYLVTDASSRLGVGPSVIALSAGAALLAAGWFIKDHRDGWAFITMALSVILTTITFFVGLYPRLLVSSLDEDWSLTIYNASSSEYTLKVMTIVALIFVPIVLLYQGWSYWVFRQRLGRDSALEY